MRVLDLVDPNSEYSKRLEEFFEREYKNKSVE